MNSVAERRRGLLGDATLFYQDPVHLVRGEGVFLYDDQGKRYIDMYNNVPCVGHGNSYVADAVAGQMSTLNVHSRYLHESILNYAERLLALHHDGMQAAVFACSGTEAAEIALMMARAATGGVGIICSDATYHGNSAEVRKMTRASLSEEPVDPHFRAVPFPQKFRPIEAGLTDDELCDRYLQTVSAAIAAFKAEGIPFAGMMVCSLFANEGLPDIPGDYMAKATTLVHEAGGVMIADEVQAGFCRSGDWWGYETSGFRPDIALMGKPMGNGVPLSGVVASHDIVDAFRKETRYFNTFASSPMQAAAGMAVLDVLEQQGLRARSAEVGAMLRHELRGMQPEFSAMADVRGHGLFIGVECVTDDGVSPDRARAAEFANRIKDRGFLLSNAGAHGNVVKIRPPLVFEHEHAELFLAAFREVASDLLG